MILNDAKRIFIIDNCDLIIKFNITIINRVDRIVRVLKQLIILFHIHMTISIKIREQFLLFNKDYFFLSKENICFEINFFSRTL